MIKHERKECPGCHSFFECKPGNITQCQCYGVLLTNEEKQAMEMKYSDCLCIDCLIALKYDLRENSKQLPLQKNDR